MSKPESSVELLAESLHNSALIQAQASEIFTVYPANTSNPEYGFLKVSSKWPRYSRVRGNPHTIPVDELDFFAMMIDERYATVPEVLRSADVIGKIATFMAGGNHVAVGDSHGDLFDVPMDLIGVSGRLREQDVPHRTAMIASKGIDYLGVKVDAIGGPEGDLVKWMTRYGAEPLSDGTIPARELLALVADTVYFTVPASASFGDEREDKGMLNLIHRFNSVSKIAIRASLHTPKRAPLLLVEGVTGTKVKELDITKYQQRTELGVTYDTIPESIDLKQNSVRIIGKISSATVDLIKGMYLVLASSDLNAHPVQFSFSDFIYMDGEHDARDVGAELVKLEMSNYPDAAVAYDARAELPTKR